MEDWRHLPLFSCCGCFGWESYIYWLCLSQVLSVCLITSISLLWKQIHQQDLWKSAWVNYCYSTKTPFSKKNVAQRSSGLGKKNGCRTSQYICWSFICFPISHHWNTPLYSLISARSATRRFCLRRAHAAEPEFGVHNSYSSFFPPTETNWIPRLNLKSSAMRLPWDTHFWILISWIMMRSTLASRSNCPNRAWLTLPSEFAGETHYFYWKSAAREPDCPARAKAEENASRDSGSRRSS